MIGRKLFETKTPFVVNKSLDFTFFYGNFLVKIEHFTWLSSLLCRFAKKGGVWKFYIYENQSGQIMVVSLMFTSNRLNSYSSLEIFIQAFLKIMAYQFGLRTILGMLKHPTIIIVSEFSV